MKRKTWEQGITLVEVVISLAIVGLILPAVGGTISMVLLLPGEREDELVAQEDLDFAAYWFLKDGRQAEIFELLASPWYGRFTWYDYSVSPYEKVRVAYKYQGGLLVRSEEHEQVVEQGRGENWETESSVARHVLAYSDALFSLSNDGKLLRVELTATVEGPSSIRPTVLTKRVEVTLGTLRESPIAAPGAEPLPPPDPSTYAYAPNREPVVVYGVAPRRGVRGNLQSLLSDDGNYYQLEGQSVGGQRVVEWWTESQTMTLPQTIDYIEGRFVGYTDKVGTYVQFFAKDASGSFQSTPAYAFTFSFTNEDVAKFFFLPADVVSYVNSEGVRKVTLKLRASQASAFLFAVDQLQFIAYP